ncbi:MAG: heavy-metal-associated domain-containing protein [Bacteroidales bacterium]|nr:heavy-metal-associated domain-containing protein [Bacteroidales bacterium]
MGLFSKKKEEPLVEKTFSVKGMMCSHCEMNVKSKLMDIPGVKEVSASSVLGKVCVEAVADVSDEMIKDAITAAGYTVVD